MKNASNIIKFVVNPILLVILVVVSVQFLLVEKERLQITDSNHDNSVGAGNNEVTPFLLSEWEPYYAGGQGLDSVITRSGSAVRVSTGADGEWYGARAEILNNSLLTNNSISFSVNADNWDALDRLLIMFSTDNGFTDYVGLNLRNYFSNPADKEWNEVVVERSVFETIEGNPEWSEISTIGIRVVPKPGFATRVWFDEFQLIPESASEATITFAFDDGFKSVAEAAKIMDEYGYDGTLFVIPDFVDTINYLTQDEVDSLHVGGWDISGHSQYNLTEQISPDVDTELALTYAYLKENEYRGRSHFAYPNGAYNRSVASQVLEYFSSARTIDGFVQPAEYAFPQHINAVTVSSSTKVTDLVKVIDQAVLDNSWLILVWHDLNENPIKDTEYNINDFRWLVEYVSSTSASVEPYSVAYEKLYE